MVFLEKEQKANSNARRSEIEAAVILFKGRNSFGLVVDSSAFLHL
jgi:hypothetical protein